MLPDCRFYVIFLSCCRKGLCRLMRSQGYNSNANIIDKSMRSFLYLIEYPGYPLFNPVQLQVPADPLCFIHEVLI